MPEVSRFYGIVITLNYDEHLPPHSMPGMPTIERRST
jgi:hypothetical protein